MKPNGNVFMAWMVNKMGNPEHVDKIAVVIQGFLGLLDKRVSRTQIVKLVYLADNLFYESTGRTITGAQYIWDHYGPNALDDSIAVAAERLVGEGEVCRVVGSYQGNHTYNYWVEDSHATWMRAASELSYGERHIVRDIAKKYGRYNATDLASLAKKTKPFENAKQHEILQFKRNEHAKELQEMLSASPDFLEEVRLGFEDLEAGRLVWADEMKDRAS